MTMRTEPRMTPSNTSEQYLRVALAPAPDGQGARGLTSVEAARRLTEFGPNLVETGSRFRLVRTGLGLLANPLVVILVVASIVSGIVRETLSAAIIVSIVLLSVALDFSRASVPRRPRAVFRALSRLPQASFVTGSSQKLPSGM
jgi:magnesium-transporting ATPase (P-type)